MLNINSIDMNFTIKTTNADNSINFWVDTKADKSNLLYKDPEAIKKHEFFTKDRAENILSILNSQHFSGKHELVKINQSVKDFVKKLGPDFKKEASTFIWPSLGTLSTYTNNKEKHLKTYLIK